LLFPLQSLHPRWVCSRWTPLHVLSCLRGGRRSAFKRSMESQHFRCWDGLPSHANSSCCSIYASSRTPDNTLNIPAEILTILRYLSGQFSRFFGRTLPILARFSKLGRTNGPAIKIANSGRTSAAAFRFLKNSPDYTYNSALAVETPYRGHRKCAVI